MRFARISSQSSSEKPQISAHCQPPLRYAAFAVVIHPLPMRVVFTPNTALIFINNNNEKLEVL